MTNKKKRKIRKKRVEFYVCGNATFNATQKFSLFCKRQKLNIKMYFSYEMQLYQLQHDVTLLKDVRFVFKIHKMG